MKNQKVFEVEILRQQPKVNISFQNVNFFKAPTKSNQSPKFDNKKSDSRNSSPNMVLVNEEPDLHRDDCDFNPIVSFIDQSIPATPITKSIISNSIEKIKYRDQINFDLSNGKPKLIKGSNGLVITNR